jgi:hypothetical protein
LEHLGRFCNFSDSAAQPGGRIEADVQEIALGCADKLNPDANAASNTKAAKLSIGLS